MAFLFVIPLLLIFASQESLHLFLSPGSSHSEFELFHALTRPSGRFVCVPPHVIDRVCIANSGVPGALALSFGSTHDDDQARVSPG